MSDPAPLLEFLPSVGVGGGGGMDIFWNYTIQKKKIISSETSWSTKDCSTLIILNGY